MQWEESAACWKQFNARSREHNMRWKEFKSRGTNPNFRYLRRTQSKRIARQGRKSATGAVALQYQGRRRGDPAMAGPWLQAESEG